jgi:membrane protein DedA with SNARE-associated domain
VGLVATDSILFSYGRGLRSQAQRRDGALRRLVRPARLRVTRRWFARYGDWLVFIARLVPGTRVVVFVSAGLNNMPLGRFLFFDALGAVLLVPALLALGWAFGEQIGSLGRTLAWASDRIALLIAVALAGWLVRVWWRRLEGGWFPPEPPVNDRREA